ncbi:MAG: OmpH family outer membrane protein [Synergistaceae bacterium]|nr:OmpH family outer membrane protein [Synergistaceae bacterium]
MSEKKRYLLMGVLALVVVAWVCSVAFAAEEERVGGIDPQSVLFQHPKYEQTLRQIRNIADQKQNEAKIAIDREPDDNKKAELFRKMRMEIAEEEQKLMQPIFKEIDLAVRTVATAKKITVVVDKTALFYGGIDITADVVQELRKISAGG